jgi:small subunit ribosomal protein S8
VLTDPIADLLVRISNGYRARHRFIDVRGSQLRKGVLSVLKTHGFVEDYLEKTEQGKVSLRVKLKYGENRQPVLQGVRRLSSPGLRRTVGWRDIPRVRGGMGIAVLSTPRGLMDGEEARRQKVGGELVCSVW